MLIRTTAVLLLYFILSTVARNKQKVAAPVVYSIDTLSRQNDSVLVRLTSHQDNLLLSDKTGFIFPDTLRFKRSRYLPIWLIPRKRFVYRIMLHGTCTEYTHERNREVTVYEHSRIMERKYYDSSNREISEQAYENYRSPMICCAIIIPGIIYFFPPLHQKKS